jgi:hypothetical protein
MESLCNNRVKRQKIQKIIKFDTVRPVYPSNRKPGLRAVTPTCTKHYDESRHFGVQARLLAGMSPHRDAD